MAHQVPKYLKGLLTKCLYVTINHKTTCYFPDGREIKYSDSVEEQLIVGLYDELDEAAGQQLLIQYTL